MNAHFRSVILVAVTLLIVSPTARAQSAAPDSIYLWPGGAPLAEGSEQVDKPILTIFLPEKANATGAAVVVLPGGGYLRHAMEKEGQAAAQWLNDQGVAAYILKYRLGPRYNHPAPLLDAQRAIRWVRSHAAEHGVDPGKVGIWGFSAGGHLAATAGTHFDSGDPDAADSIDRVSSRPDFLILAYPVITMEDDYVHEGSRTRLLGETPDPALIENLSNHKQVTPETPPTFLFHTDEDTGVPSENSVQFYLALREAGVPAEMHIYERGRHGVGLAPGDPILSSWTDRLRDWMAVRGLIPM